LLQHAGYKAITHGLSVHREDLDSGSKLKDVLSKSEAIPINIDELYQRRIKTIYGAILDFATRLQAESNLSEAQVEAVRNILIADRLLVRTVKRMQPLHDNIILFMTSGNDAIIREYNVIRRRILKVMREIHRASESDNPLRHIRKLEKQRGRASELDVLATGRVNRLLLEGQITQVMATSLINDSEQASKIVHSLIDVATLLYYPKDRLVAVLEEQVPPG
jgi:phosphate:Na+ symporter